MDHYVVVILFPLGMEAPQINRFKMDKDTIANAITVGGVFSYLMHFQGELTLLLLITGLIVNIIRIYDRVKNQKNP
jgi:hypothetical protein